jgi:hypothetical protein
MVMKDITANLANVTGGIAQSNTASANRPGWNNQGPAQWNIPSAPQWNGPQPKMPSPTVPLGPWAPSPQKQWA